MLDSPAALRPPRWLVDQYVAELYRLALAGDATAEQAETLREILEGSGHGE